MVTPELITYIKLERSKGTADALIKANLASQGWSGIDFDEAVYAIDNGGVIQPKGKQVAPELKTYRSNYKWLLFAVGTVTAFGILFGTSGFNLGTASFGAISLLAVASAVIAVYVSAYVISGMMKPQTSLIANILYFIVNLILTIVLSYILGFGIFFVLCIFVGFTGSLGNL